MSASQDPLLGPENGPAYDDTFSTRVHFWTLNLGRGNPQPGNLAPPPRTGNMEPPRGAKHAPTQTHNSSIQLSSCTSGKIPMPTGRAPIPMPRNTIAYPLLVKLGTVMARADKAWEEHVGN